MGMLLLTGGSGFIGTALLPRLAERGEVAAIGRAALKGAPAARVKAVKGVFHSFEDLRQLDGLELDGLVHLAAVTGGCSEEDGIAVNVAGTRRLLRYLSDRGCRKFVLASSIAACGSLTVSGEPFRPRALPIPADHPCVARDGYGLSKGLMEEVAAYWSRMLPDADVTCLRFGAVVDERTWTPKPVTAAKLPSWGFVMMGKVALADVIDGVMAVVEAAPRPGYRVCNLVGPDNACDTPVPELIPRFLGRRAEGLDLSRYTRAGREFDALFSMDEMKREYGFAPRVPVRHEAFLKWKETRQA